MNSLLFNDKKTNVVNMHIGLGGFGAKAVEKLSAMKEEKDKYIAILSIYDCLETTSEKVKAFCLKPINDFLLLKSVRNAGWYPDDRFFASETSRASVRINGRLMVETAISKSLPMFFDEITDAEGVASIHIYVSIMGGTGSGALLPFVLFLKQYYQEKFNFIPKIYAHFLKMEAIERTIPAKQEKDYLTANSCAFLMEIEAINDICYKKSNIDLFMPKLNIINQSPSSLLLDGFVFVGEGNGNREERVVDIEGLAKSEVADMSYEEQKNMLAKTKKPYIETYIKIVAPLFEKDSGEIIVLPYCMFHIDQRWHNLLRKYILE